MRARVIVAACALCASACAAEVEPELPPVTPEASYPLFASASAAPPLDPAAADRSDFKARLVLQKILRGAGAGRVKVCGWVVPAHAEKRFGKPCARWVAELAPVDRTRLRRVRVSRATAGADGSEWIVETGDLVWPKGRPESLRPAPYVLRLIGTRWMLAG